MADSLRWLFEVQNRVSGPAKAAAGDLGKLRDRLAGATAATKSFNAAQRRTGAALGGARSMAGTPFDRAGLPRSFDMRGGALRDVARQTRGLNAGLAAAGTRAFAVVGAILAIGRGLQAAGDLMMRLARGAADLTRQFTEAVIQAGLLRSRALFGLERILGSPGAARGVLAEARELSEFLGTDLTQTVTGIQDLLVRGFSRGEATRIFQGLADLQTISPTPVDMSRIVLAIGQIRNAGRLQGDELRQLQESGLPLDAVRQAMARRLGTSTDQLAELQRAGRIDADTAIASILEGISMRTGRDLGGAAREFSQTLPGQLMRLQQAPARIFDAIAESSDGAFGGLRDVLVQINTLLDPTSTQFQAIVNTLSTGFSVVIDVLRTAFDIGRALFEGIFGATGTDASRGLEDALQGVRDALAWLRQPETLAKVRAFGAGLVAAWRATEPLRTGLLILAGIVGVVIAAIGVSLATIAAAAVAVPTIIIGTISLVLGFLAELAPRAVQFGANIVQGLIAGITSMLGALRSTAQSMGSTVLGAVTGALGIASPSREMRWLGEMTGAGFQLGLDSSMPAVAVPTPQLGAGAGAAGGGIQIGTLIGSIEVSAPNGEGIADELGRILPAHLQAAFEMLAAEYGMA